MTAVGDITPRDSAIVAAQHAAHLARTFFPSGKRHGDIWVTGDWDRAHGPISITLAGPDAGRWHAHNTDLSGDLIRLVSLKQDVDFPTAAKLATVLASQKQTSEAPNWTGRLAVSAALEQSPPPRRWLWSGWLPRKTVALFAAPPGTGKSLLALQLMVAVAAGRELFGGVVDKGSALGWFSEDDADELHRRLHDIHVRDPIASEAADRLHIVDRVGHDNILAGLYVAPEVSPGPAYDLLRWQIERVRPSLVVLDNLAHMFAGNENDRTHVVAFLSFLERLAREFDTTILLLSHPSRMNAVSGSTGWEAHVRTVITLSGACAVASATREDDGPIDPNLRTLARHKANYAERGMEVALRWEDGVLVPTETPNAQSGDYFDRLTEEKRCEATIIEGIEWAEKKNYRLIDHPTNSPNYIFTLLKRNAKDRGLKRASLDRALRRLIDTGAVQRVRDGPPSDNRHKLIVKPLPPVSNTPSPAPD